MRDETSEASLYAAALAASALRKSPGTWVVCRRLCLHGTDIFLAPLSLSGPCVVGV